MPADLIPALDPAPLPGPPWLFHVLWVVTFTIHILFVNAVLGGSLLAALAGRRPGRRDAARLLVGVNSWAISFAITFAIAPLLFIQVLLGRFFYTATVLVGWAWLGMLGLLTVAYYLNYMAKHRFATGRPARALLTVQAALFLVIAGVLVVVNLLHMQPGRWEAVAAQPWAALSDPTFVPRYLHFLLAAVTLAGGLVAFAAVRSSGGRSREDASEMARFGIRAALAATVLQLAAGFWLLLALPEPVLKGFMRAGPVPPLVLGAGILLGLVLVVVLARIADPLQQPKLVRHALELLVGATIVMVVTRHTLRDIYLAAARAGEEVVVATRWDIIGLFVVLFLAGVAVTIWAMWRAATDHPAEGEPAA